MQEVRGTVAVKAAKCDVAVDLAGESVSAKSANGNLRLKRVSAGFIEAKISPGEIEVGIAEGSAAWIEANSKFGRIRNQLSVDKSEAATQTVAVQAQTSVGDIVIRRAG